LQSTGTVDARFFGTPGYLVGTGMDAMEKITWS
jgi:hypothetical protein